MMVIYQSIIMMEIVISGFLQLMPVLLVLKVFRVFRELKVLKETLVALRSIIRLNLIPQMPILVLEILD